MMLLMLLLLLVLLLNCLLLHGEVPCCLTLLLVAVVLIQNTIQMRYVLIGDHFVLKGVPHQQITGLLVIGFGAIWQYIFLRENVHGATVDSQSRSLEDSSLGRFRWQRR